MIIYNITINVSDEIHDQWINWMKEDHIPKVLSTDLFISASLNRIISNKDTGTTYAIAYKIESLSLLQKYETEFAPKLRNEYGSKFLDKAPAFRTIMQVEDEF